MDLANNRQIKLPAIRGSNMDKESPLSAMIDGSSK